MEIDFEKMDGLVPAIIQDADTLKVLMMGFMNEEAFRKTQETGLVTFYSRTREVAEILELNYDAARKLLYRAKIALKDQLEKEGMSV